MDDRDQRPRQPGEDSSTEYAAALRESEERLRRLLDTTPHGIQEIDTEGTILLSNRAHHDMLGYADGELIGLNVTQLVPEEDRPGLVADIREILRRQPEPFPYRCRDVTKDGRIFDCEVAWNYKRDAQGKIVGFACVVTDVSEQVRAEKASRESEARLREFQAIVTRSPAVVLLRRVSEDWPVEFVTENVSQFGYRADDFTGGRLRWNDLIHPEDRPRLEAEIAHYRRENIMEFSQEYRLETREGKVRWVEEHCLVLPGSDGRAARLQAVVLDVTDRKRAEQAIRAEGNRLRRSLEMHERDREMVAYEIHDGFVQPLSATLMQLDAAMRVCPAECPSGSREGGLKAAKLLRETIGEARRLVGGLRPATLNEFGLIAALEGLVADWRSEDGTAIEFVHEVQFDRLEPPLETAVFRIIQESLVNALRHSGSETVRIELTQRDGHLQIDVRDWGAGFDPTEIQRNHFGLEGLRQRARAFGGRIHVDTRPGQGTHVSVSIPVDGRAAEP